VKCEMLNEGGILQSQNASLISLISLTSNEGSDRL